MRIPFSIVLKPACLLFIVGVLIFSVAPQKAVAESPWLTGEPHISDTDRVLNYQDFYALRVSKNGPNPGVDCINKKIARRKLGPWTMQYEDTCWYSTKIGLISKRGDYLLQPGTDVAGHIVNNFLDSRTWPMFFPTPNPDMFLELVSNQDNGYYLAFRRVGDISFERTEDTFGTTTLKIQGPSTYEPYNENVPSYARRFVVTPDKLWWSNDGDYMLVAKDNWLYRFNLTTFKVISTQMAQYPGFHITSSASITTSGKYAALAVETAGLSTDIAIVDFETCTAGESPVVNVSRTCQVRSFKSLLKQHATFTSVHLPRFYGENTLGVYLYDKNLPDNGFKQYLLQASGTEYSTNNYVALGDSFSSGEGVGDYIPGTDVQDVNMCHTSGNSYPYLINQQLDLTSFFSVACSGARIKDVLDEGQWNDVLPEENLGSDRHPGYIKQLDILPLLSPDIVTLTMSGNDIGFSDKLKYCLLLSSDCYSSYEDRKQIADEVRALHPKLVEMYEKILDKNGPKSRLFVLGYPQIISNDEGVACGVNTPMNTYQRNMANDLITYFNAVIKSAVTQAGAYYVGTESALNGHRLCDDVAATMAVNGITAGNDIGIWKLKALGNESFHPNQLGHQLLKNTVLERTSSLTVPMPAPNKSEPIPNPEEYPFLDAPSDGELVRKLYYNSQAQPSLWKVGADALIKVTNPLIPIPPFTTFDVFLHSDPVKLGQVQSNGAGSINAQLEIPDSVPPGLHELHMQGTGGDGGPIDIYEFVYVAANETDFDGDGLLNEDEPCGVIQASGTDQDQDGVDDACDGEIDVAPDTTAPVVTGTPERQPDNGEWYNHDVTINWNATDPDPSSGAPTQPAPSAANQEGVHTYTSAESCDPLDNCATGNLEIKLDKTAPQIDFHISPAPSVGGWNNSDATVTFNCSDATSGVASCTDPVTVSDGDGGYIVTGTATDNAGNTTQVNAVVMIDRTAPAISNLLNSVANADGWHNTDVTVTPECNDTLSGILECSAPTVLSSEGANQTITSTAKDKAGNVATTTTTVNIDKTAPTLGAPAWSGNPKPTTDSTSLTIPATDNQSGIVEAEYFLGDDDPGQGNGATMTMNGDNLTTTFGTDFPTGVWKVSVRAKDKAGNWSDVISDYLVVYDASGVRMTGRRTLLPSLESGDVLPGLVTNDQDDRAHFGFSVRYDRDGQIHPFSDFQFSYKTGAGCFNPFRSQNCHLFYLNATSIEWLATQGANDSTGLFQGTARLWVDDSTRQVVFRLTGIDGERLDDTSSDHLTLKVFASGENPNTATPIYQVNAEVTRGNIRIRTQ